MEVGEILKKEHRGCWVGAHAHTIELMFILLEGQH